MEMTCLSHVRQRSLVVIISYRVCLPQALGTGDRTMRKQLAALVIAGTAVAGLAVAPTAQAADTNTSFALTGGALSVSVPANATITGAATSVGGQALTGALGAVQVTDARGSLVATWTASVDGSDFTTGEGEEAAEIVPDDEIDYWSGAATATTGVVVATPGQALAINAQDLSASRTAMGGVGVGNNTATWNPTVIVNVPAGNVAGTYTGTITHSVA
jgi:hypothetical protein